MQENANDIVTMLNTRGRVVRVRVWEVPLCREQGMKMISNPKREYYPEFDSENQRAIPLTENLAENIADGNLLKVKQI